MQKTKIKSIYLLLEEYSNKLSSLMDSFYVEISGKRINICWFVKVRGYLEKVEKDQQRIKQEKLFTVSVNSNP